MSAAAAKITRETTAAPLRPRRFLCFFFFCAGAGAAFFCGGLFGFGATCLMSPVVAYIQGCGNRLLGLKMYPAQFVSAAAFCILAALIAYLRLRVIPGEKG